MTDSAVGVTSRRQSSTAAPARLSGDRRETALKPTLDHSSRSGWSPRILIAQVGVIALALGLWAYLSTTASDGSVPSPARTFGALGDLLATQDLWDAVGQTATTWLVGIVSCSLIGIPLGLLIGCSRLATQSTRLTIDFVRNIPPVALVPLGLLLWGPTRSMVLLLVISGTIWPIVIQSIYASQQTEPQLRDVARVFHLGKGWRLTHVFLPGVTPFVMTGLRVAATICLLLTVTGELFGGAPGVGTQIQQALVGNDYPQMYAYVVVAAVLGLAVNSLIWIGQRRLLRWHPSFQQEA
jgi:ABC-type nitrate/sulfonate/bicarbonate transport system permease component